MKTDKIAAVLKGLGAGHVNTHKRTGWVVSACPLGPWKHEGGKSSDEVFGVRTETGDPSCGCFACGYHGTLGKLLMEMKFKNKMQPRVDVKWGPLFDLIDEAVIAGDLDLDTPDIEQVMAMQAQDLHLFPDWWLDTFPKALDIPWARKYLRDRGLLDSMIERMEIRADTNQMRVCFPVRDFRHRLVGLHGRAIDTKTEPRYRMYLQAGHNNPIVWLGEDWVDLNAPILVVEGPFDLASALRVYDNTVTPLFVNPSIAKLKRMTDAMEWVTLYDRGAGGDAGRAKVQGFLGSDHVVSHAHPPKGRKDPGEMNVPELEAALEGHLTIKHQSSNSHLIAQTACLDQANQA